ncbi:MAG: hypothetical protein EPN26_04320 [Rhodospirillales bacterium]|nr:MAG: hypothetical protein EPN26_04320 [Rhodospirillales bacterium]
MNIDEALSWYAQDRFTAEDVTRATGLSERAQRELLKIGVLQAIPQAKTKARLLDSRMVKRAAVVAQFNRCGLSLSVAGQVVYAAPMLEDFAADLDDPIDAFRKADPHGLYSPSNRPCKSEIDYTIEIVNARYVVDSSCDVIGVYGELTADGTEFLWWKNSVPYYGDTPAWEHNRSMSPELLNFTLKEVNENDEEEAQFYYRNSQTRISINVSLTLRIALRRLLYIDTPE